MMNLLEEADVEPTTQAKAAVQRTARDYDSLVARWTALIGTELPALNAKLKAAGQPAIAVPR
jgi:hypothetical protein